MDCRLSSSPLQDDEGRREEPSLSPSSPDVSAWTNPVFIGSFILRGAPHLHLRETTAVLNLRALTMAVDLQSQWMGKLRDFVSLTALPYVPTVGQPLKLTADYRGIDPVEAPPSGEGVEDAIEAPQPPL